VSEPLLLVTNDDGIEAPGLEALAEGLQGLGEVHVVAPHREQSATSHSLTLHKPLRVVEHGARRHAVSGTPTDCVLLAVRELLPRRPAMVVSGINRGPNLGDDVSYSGTVSAALEGALLGIPAVALSRIGGPRAPAWPDAARIARDIVVRALDFGFPERSYLNVNIPARPLAEIRGVRLATLGVRHYSEEIVKNVDPRGRPYYWIGGEAVEYQAIPGTDCAVVGEGWVSVTPLTARWELTQQVESLRDAGFEGLRWTP
jgi:5'-nucleotidase